jgi:hypothetical protein
MRKKNLPVPALALAFMVAAASNLGAPGTAGAQPTIKDASDHTNDRPMKLDITGSLGFFGDFGVGLAGWVSMPIVPNGFIPPLNDSFYLEFGIATTYTWVNNWYGQCDYNYFDLAPMGGVRWNFHLTEAWTVFAKAKLGVGYHFNNVDCPGIAYRDSDLTQLYLASDGGVGAYWNFSPGMGMRFDLGYHGASVGLSWNF